MMRRIGLTQRVDDYSDRGERRDALDQAWVSLVLKLGYVPVPLPNLVEDVRDYLDALSLDGVIVTGGNDLQGIPGATSTAIGRDRFEHELLDICAETHRSVLGVCRGLQLAVIHHGGRLTELEGHIATRHRLTVQSCNGLPFQDREIVNSFHRFGVRPADLDDQWHVLATADDGTVEAIKHQTHPLWAIMWHPERDPADSKDSDLIQYVFERQSL